MLALQILLVTLAPFTPTALQSGQSPFLAERAAVGGDAWNRVRTIRLEGSISEGGASGKFVRIVDHVYGRTRLEKWLGQYTVSGFDGRPWGAHDGIVARVDLPSAVLDGRVSAFIARDAWWDSKSGKIRELPASASGERHVEIIPNEGGSIEAFLDSSTHLLTKTVEHTDWGDSTTTYSDWREVDGVKLPYRVEQLTADGDTVVQTVDRASLSDKSNDFDFAPPPASPHGVLKEGLNTPFTLAKSGHIVIQGRLNDQPATFILDTGAGNYIIKDAAARFGLKTVGGVSLSGPAGRSEDGGFAKVDKLEIAGGVLKDEMVVVGPAPWGRAASTIDGLTGGEFLSEFRTTIDYPHKTLRFAPFSRHDRIPGVTKHLYSDGGNVFVEAEIQGKKGLFRVDTGAAGKLTVFKSFADANGIFQAGGTSQVDAGGLGGSVPVKGFDDAKLVLGDHVFDHLTVKVSDVKQGAFASRTLAGNLSADILSQFCITFDYLAHRITFMFGG